MGNNISQSSLITPQSIQELRNDLRLKNMSKLQQNLKVCNRAVSVIEIKALRQAKLDQEDLNYLLTHLTWRNQHFNEVQLKQLVSAKRGYNNKKYSKKDWYTWEYGHNKDHTVIVHQHK